VSYSEGKMADAKVKKIVPSITFSSLNRFSFSFFYSIGLVNALPGQKTRTPGNFGFGGKNRKI
jgi:hypothetical protein